jgi:hypothetical protein
MNMDRFTILSLLFVSILTAASSRALAQVDALSVIMEHRNARARADLDTP